MKVFLLVQSIFHFLKKEKRKKREKSKVSGKKGQN
jgi:hypothetical protein